MKDPAPLRIFKSLADEVRLRLLCLLLQGEWCVGDLVEVLELPQPTVSRHLAHLRAAGLVRLRKVGLWRFYAQAEPKSDLHARILDCLALCMTQRDRKRAAAVRASGGCCPENVRDSKCKPDASACSTAS